MEKRLHTVWYPVKDVKRAARFYREVLGLVHRFTDRDGWWAEFEAGGAKLGLHKKSHGRKGHHEVPDRQAVAVLEVDDLKAASAELKRKGVRFRGPVVRLGSFGSIASFEDPDGNLLQLFQYAKPSAPRAAQRRKRGEAYSEI